MAHYLISLFILFTMASTSQSSKFTATYYFGDSLLDTGNNNHIVTPLKADHRPYGRDFPGQVPTGRFCNGLMIPDLLSSKLRIKNLVPPYLDPELNEHELKTGVNFASAGAGYDEFTSILSGTMPVSKQMKLFDEYVEKLERIVGEKESKRILRGSLVMFSSGSNDFALNFFVPVKRFQYGLNGYIAFLQNVLKGALKDLYDHGVRKFIIAGVPPFGCMPINIIGRLLDPILPNKYCIPEEDSAATSYNSKLQGLLTKMQSSLAGSKIFYLDFHNNMLDMINNPGKYGFEETRKGCCGLTGAFEVGHLCNSWVPTCTNASTYAFFDGVHPTETVYKFITQQIMRDIIPKF